MFASIIGVVVGGCAAPRSFFKPAVGYHVWPSAPESPRVRYLGEISGPFGEKNSTMERVLFGPAPAERLVTPHGVAVDETGRWIAVADTNGHRVYVFDLQTQKHVALVGAGDGVGLDAPIGVAFCNDRIFVSDPPRRAIEVYSWNDATGAAHQRTVVVESESGTSRPSGMCCDIERNRIYVCDAAAHRVVVLDLQGTPIGTIGEPGSGPGQFRFPAHVACAEDGSIAVSDGMNFRVQRASADGKVLEVFGRKGDAAGDFALPKGVAADRDGNLWVVDAQFENVQAFNPRGELLLSMGGEGHGPGEFWLPAGAFIDRQDRLWVADTYNRRVQAFQLIR